MAPSDLRRPFKRLPISDQQRRRDLSLQRQAQNRSQAQQQARCLTRTLLSFPVQDSDVEIQIDVEEEQNQGVSAEVTDNVLQAAKLKGFQARKWFSKQLMLPEWMVDIPERLNEDWFVSARPAGKRCFVVSSNGTTVSRLRNGIILHRFPSALPNGARIKNRSAQSYCILDCIYHEPDQTYYAIDLLSWGSMSLYECTAEFRFFWMNSKLIESGACDAPSTYHKYRFSTIHVYNSDQEGLKAAYTESAPYVKDGILFYNKHAHYQPGTTPLVLVWKDVNCSQYVLDTDDKGQIPDQQQLVLELLDDGRLGTSDDPPVIFGSLNKDFILQNGFEVGNLLRFSISEGGLSFMDRKLERADLHYLGKPNRARAFADSYSKVVFQYSVRHSPLTIDHIFASIYPAIEEECYASDAVMVG